MHELRDHRLQCYLRHIDCVRLYHNHSASTKNQVCKTTEEMIASEPESEMNFTAYPLIICLISCKVWWLLP